MEEQLKKYFQGEMNASERLELLRKVNSDESLKMQFIELQNLNALSTIFIAEDDKAIGENNYIRFIHQNKKKKAQAIALKITKYAAVIALLITATWAITYNYTTSHFHKPIAYNTLYVPTGQRACLSLQDGTKVWLNARSTLTYPTDFSEKERRVDLVGEAFFEVSKDPDKPFIVSSKEVDVKVLGTKFNVHSYPETSFVRTCLLEGSVEVSFKAESTSKSIRLLPNQQVVVENGKMKVDNIKHLSYFLWKDGIYSFQKEPFRNIVKELEIYYDVKIVIQDPSIANFVYTGKFRQQDGVYEILRIIQKIQNFAIKKDEKTNTITLSK